MNKIVAAVAAIAFTVGTFAMPMFASPAHAQAGTAVCEARSPSAIGYGVAYNSGVACQRALYECSIRTPNYQICAVTRWWWQ